jgi:hypothetical protein
MFGEGDGTGTASRDRRREWQLTNGLSGSDSGVNEEYQRGQEDARDVPEQIPLG